MNVRIALTCGDPAGVGPEIIERWLDENPAPKDQLTVLGPDHWVQALQKQHPHLAVEPVGPHNFPLTPGAPSVEGANVALAAMERAATGTRSGHFDAVVTAPVSKLWLQKAGYPFPGQTEFFADCWGGQPVMAFAGGKLRVALATWHIQLAEVPTALSKEKLQRACAAATLLARADGANSPRIAVCGLNPHAGEDGLLGRDELDRINPWLATIRKENGLAGLSDCLPPDTVFQRQLRGDFDAVVALYHDQGLAPLKTLEFDQSVNCTLGLPHVRTSPDHGTAFDIAGQGKASTTSFANAVTMAARLARIR